ncbi:MAG: hypothetical protein DWI22_02810 [Planctomycetota bacterium]|nr:MAG: hypothetical protein DWI22_02810 [Planctomycetota bacterium]
MAPKTCFNEDWANLIFELGVATLIPKHERDLTTGRDHNDHNFGAHNLAEEMSQSYQAADKCKHEGAIHDVVPAYHVVVGLNQELG